jgi:hypothetical protein
MPGNLLEATITASPNNVLPQMTYIKYGFTRQYPVLQNILHMGDIQQSNIQDGVNAPESMKTYNITVRLTPTALTALRNFYKAQSGTFGCWYFYDPWEPDSGQPIGSNFDSTGDSTIGRHTCKFLTNAWTEQFTMGRMNVTLAFEEVN